MSFRIKSGTTPSHRLEMIKVRKVVERVFAKRGMTTWLTSGMDREHSAGSLHYAGYAEDYDAEIGLSQEDWAEVRQEVIDLLYDPRYQVIAHFGHLHVEYDPPEFKQYK